MNILLTSKNIALSIGLCLILSACGDSSNDDINNSSNENLSKDSNVLINTNSSKNTENLSFDAVGLYQESKKKLLKNISSVQLAKLSGECAEKYSYTDKCIENKFSRNVVIAIDNKEKVTLSGKILTDIRDARVCLDINEDNLCGWNEPLAISKSNGSFDLKVDKDGEYKNKYGTSFKPNIIAIRGFDNKTYRDSKTIFKLKYPENTLTDLELSPYSTIMLANAYISDVGKDNLKTILGLNESNNVLTYKKNILFERVIDIILTPILGQKTDKEIMDARFKFYGNILVYPYEKTNLTSIIEDLKKSHEKKVITTLKSLIEKVDALNLTEDLKESYAVVLRSKVLAAQKHFRKSDENLTLDLSNLVTSKLKSEAIKIRLAEIGLSNITDEMITVVENNNLKIRDLEDIYMVKDIPELDELEKLLDKKNKATSKLFIQSVLLSDKTLEVYYYTSAKLSLSESSKAKLNTKENIEKIYTIEGLNYEIESVSWNNSESKHIIKFVNKLTSKGQARRLYVNYLALEDTDGKYTPAKPKYAYIGSPREIPITGQEKVWEKYDDGSYQYGMNPNYQKKIIGSDKVLNSQKTNLQFQDTPYVDGTNDNIIFQKAIEYCENLSYAGKDDWRMPNMKELVSTTSINMQKPSIFEHDSESEISFTKNVWKGFLTGNVTGVNKYGEVATLVNNIESKYSYEIKEKYSVRCLRNLDENKGSLFPDFAEDNIVVYKTDKLSYDPSTKLMYLDEPITKDEKKVIKSIINTPIKDIKNVGKFGDLAYATKYCNDLNKKGYEGFKGWRLPNINEMFYLLNANGVATFQHRVEVGLNGGYMTSSYSLKDDGKYPWVTGKHNFARRTYNESDKGYFKCVRSMDKDYIKEAKEVTHKETPKNRLFTPINNEVNISLPLNVFHKDEYGGIKLTANDSKGIRNYKQYEIQNIVPKDHGLNPKLKSIILDNTDLCDPHVGTEWWDSSYKRCNNIGYFRINNGNLMSSRYGKLKLEEGKTYKVLLGTQIGFEDLTINLTIEDNK